MYERNKQWFQARGIEQKLILMRKHTHALNYLYNGDCMELLKTYPDNFFDCCVSDVPYKIVTGGARVTEESINKFGAKYTKGILKRRRVNNPLKPKWLKQGDGTSADEAALLVSKGKLFENCDIKFSEWLPEVYRVMKNGPTHLFYGQRQKL